MFSLQSDSLVIMTAILFEQSKISSTINLIYFSEHRNARLEYILFFGLVGFFSVNEVRIIQYLSDC